MKGYLVFVMKKVIDDCVLLLIGGLGVLVSKGKFKFYK